MPRLRINWRRIREKVKGSKRAKRLAKGAKSLAQAFFKGGKGGLMRAVRDVVKRRQRKGT